MHISLAVIDQDVNFLNRFSSKLSSLYSSNISIATYSEITKISKNVNFKKYDVIWVAEDIEVPKDIFENEELIYMSTSKAIATIHGKKAIMKYQNVHDIFDQINMYVTSLDKNSKYEKTTNIEENIQTIFVSGVTGGVGASTYAISLGRKLVEDGYKVMYLDLNPYSNIDILKDKSNDNTMDDLYLLVKNALIKGEDQLGLSAKIKKIVSRDSTGINFVKPWNSLLKSSEVKSEESYYLVDKLVELKAFNYLIVDCRMHLDRSTLSKMSEFGRVKLVSDNSNKSNAMAHEIMNTIKLFDEKMIGRIEPISDKLSLVYNRMKTPDTVDFDYPVELKVREKQGRSLSEIIDEINNNLKNEKIN